MRSAPAAIDAAVRPRPRGAAGRVAAVHGQTRRGLAVTLGFLLAAVIVAIVRADHGWWAPLHLFTVGALLSAISTTTQMLAVTWSAAPAPAPSVAAAQRWVLAAGAVTMVIGHESARSWLFVSGGVAVVVAMVALVPILLVVRRRAVTPRFAPAIAAYVVAVLAGSAGMSIGLVLGTGRGGERVLELRGAHLVLNLLGLVGLVVAGTLPFFAATQMRSRMGTRATPRRIRLTLATLALAVAVAALARVADHGAGVAVGLGGYAAGLVGVATLLPLPNRDRLSWGGPRVVQLLCGLGWWIAMTIALAVVIVRDTNDRPVLQALVIGGFAQILVASLAYLGPVLRGGGHRRLAAGFAVTRSWPSLVAGNAAAVAALAEHRAAMAIALSLWLADVAGRAVALVASRKDPSDV